MISKVINVICIILGAVSLYLGYMVYFKKKYSFIHKDFKNKVEKEQLNEAWTKGLGKVFIISVVLVSVTAVFELIFKPQVSIMSFIMSLVLLMIVLNNRKL